MHFNCLHALLYRDVYDVLIGLGKHIKQADTAAT